MRFRKICFILIYQLLMFTTADAQFNLNMSRATVRKKSLHLKHPCFHEITIIDNRYDTTIIPDIRIDRDLYLPFPFVGSTTDAMRHYIDKALKNLPTNDKSLLIELRHFEYTYRGVSFSANAYLPSGDKDFIKIASIDTVFKTQAEKYISGKAVDIFLKELDNKAEMDLGYPADKLSLRDILDNRVENTWAAYPINRTEVYSDGIFTSYGNFRDNQPEKHNLNVTMRQDSVYLLNFTDTLTEEKKEIGQWIYKFRYHGILSCKGQLYCMLDYPLCLPLTKKGNTFYFHLPNSLPNMYFINLAEVKGNAVDNGAPGAINDAGSLVYAVARGILSVIIKQAALKSVVKKGLADPSFRDCYIDLDTGMIEYR